MMVLKEKDEILERANKFERQIDKIKNAPKPVTIHLSQENFETSRSTK